MTQLRKIARISSKISVVILVLVQLSIATNSTSPIEADEFKQQNDLKQQVQTSESSLETKPKRAGQQTVLASGRSGRMLDLDVLAGDIGKHEKAAKERSLSGNRQSRTLTDDLAISENGATQKVEGRSPKKTANKKMSIKGFIPIVSLENGKHFDPSQMLGSDSDSDDDNGNESGAETESNGSTSSAQNDQHNNLREHLVNNYGGHTSIGHASFAPTPTNINQQQQQQQQQQQFSNEQQWQQMVASQLQQQYSAPQDQMQPEVSRANRKLQLGTSGILSGLTGGAKRGLVSSLVPSALSPSGFAGANQYNSPYQQQQQQLVANHLSGPMNLPPVQATFGLALDSSQGGDCICVPFFQCKNGFLSESQLSKSQLAQLNQLSSPVHQIPRSLNSFKSSSSLQPVAANAYNQYQSQPQSQMSLAADQLQQLQQLQQQQGGGLQTGQQQLLPQASQQQQLVNDMIYDQLRKSIESSNLEQQLQQQEAYNDANQQQLALIDERHSKSGAAANSSSSETSVEGEERSLLNPLGNRRQYQVAQQKCGIMRTCCRIPPRTTRGATTTNYARPTIASAAARFVNPQQQALATTSHLIASPSITRPQNRYQLIQPMRQQQQYQPSMQATSLVGAPQSHMADFNSQLGASSSNQMADTYQQMQATAPMQPLALGSQQQYPPRPAAVQPSGSFMQGRCGMRQTLGISGRVQNSDSQQLANGESTAEFGEFPAHAAILKRLSPGDSLFVCSAVLISSQWLATAAHCVRKSRPDELKVRLGEWDVNRDDEFYPFFESNVREIVLHPDFQPSSLINDIALLRIEQAVDQQQMPHIAPVCLAAPSDQQAAFQFNGQRCWVTGWGKDAFGQQGAFQSVLKKVDLPVVSHQDCELALKYQTKLGKHFRLHSSNICAGGERGKDACEGDGGAGLYCLDPNSGLSKAVGLVSWGVGCGQRGVPGVYVSLAHFNAWIESVVVSSGEENVYLDARMNGADSQAFKNIISERSNQASSLNGTMATSTTTSTPQPPTTTTSDTIMIEEARSANGTHAQ